MQDINKDLPEKIFQNHIIFVKLLHVIQSFRGISSAQIYGLYLMAFLRFMIE